MSKQKKTFKRDLSFDEKNGHHYRAARRVQEQKLDRRESKGARGGRAWLPKAYDLHEMEE
jgi:hypothetical protein